MTPTIQQTRDFIRTAHLGQTDKGGQPYHEHVERVALRVGAKLAAIATRRGLDEAFQNDVITAALLHDVVEDTPYGLSALADMGYNDRVLTMLKFVTRPEAPAGLTYQQWVQWIADSGNLGAILIKLSDNEDNSEPTRIAQLPEAQQGILDRYERSKRRLIQALRHLGFSEVVDG